MPSDRYTITMNRKQLGDIGRALEACFRMGIGQPSNALAYCRDRDGKPAIYGWNDVQDVERVIKSKMGLHPNASWGVGRFPELDVLCEMYKTIERFMSWERAVEEGIVPSMDAPRKWPEMFGCNYDDPMKYTDEPMIEVQKGGIAMPSDLTPEVLAELDRLRQAVIDSCADDSAIRGMCGAVQTDDYAPPLTDVVRKVVEERDRLRADRDRLQGLLDDVAAAMFDGKPGEQFIYTPFSLPKQVQAIREDRDTLKAEIAKWRADTEVLRTLPAALDDLREENERLKSENEKLKDNPDFDATDAAHPAWWRGNDAGVEAACDQVLAMLSTGRRGSYGSPKLTAISEKVERLTREIDEARAAKEGGWRFFVTAIGDLLFATRHDKPGLVFGIHGKFIDNTNSKTSDCLVHKLPELTASEAYAKLVDWPEGQRRFREITGWEPPSEAEYTAADVQAFCDEQGPKIGKEAAEPPAASSVIGGTIVPAKPEADTERVRCYKEKSVLRCYSDASSRRFFRNGYEYFSEYVCHESECIADGDERISIEEARSLLAHRPKSLAEFDRITQAPAWREDGGRWVRNPWVS